MMGLCYFDRKINISNICQLSEKVANIGNMIGKNIAENVNSFMKIIIRPSSPSQI